METNSLEFSFEKLPSKLFASIDVLDSFIETSIASSNQPPSRTLSSGSTTVLVTGSDGKNNDNVGGGSYDDILQAADFLYENSLESALTILESDPSRYFMRLVSLQSKRNVYIIKGKNVIHSSSSKSAANSSNVIDTTSYTCIMHENPSEATTTTITTNGIKKRKIMLPASPSFCSCRSFMEHCRTSFATHNNCSSSSTSFCKHLLALKLMLTMDVPYSIVEVPTDEEFSKQVLRHMSLV